MGSNLESVAVLLAGEDSLPFVSAGGDVVESSRVLNAKGSGHAIMSPVDSFQCQDLTPYHSTRQRGPEAGRGTLPQETLHPGQAGGGGEKGDGSRSGIDAQLLVVSWIFKQASDACSCPNLHPEKNRDKGRPHGLRPPAPPCLRGP